MDITKELAEAKERRVQIVNQINQLKQQEQALLQEALRIDGEVRMLERFSKDGEKPQKKDA